MLDQILKKFCLNPSADSTKSDNIDGIPKSPQSDSQKIPGNANPIEASDLQPRLLMHHGLLTTCTAIVFDPFLQTLAIASQDGHIKVFATTGLELLLRSPRHASIRFLQFFHNKGLLLSINEENDIELWDIGLSALVGSRRWGKNVTTVAIIQGSKFFYVGDKTGAVSVLSYNHQKQEFDITAYSVTSHQTLGGFMEVDGNITLIDVLPQPGAEFERVLLCYTNGVCVLWALHEKEVLSVYTNKKSQISKIMEMNKQYDETDEDEEIRNLMCACWCCPKGTVFATGYTDGSIWLWNVPQVANVRTSTDDRENKSMKYSCTPVYKLKGQSIAHVTRLRWLGHDDSRTDRSGYIFATGGKTLSSQDMIQVISLKEVSLRSKYSLEFAVPGSITGLSALDIAGECNVIVIALKSQRNLHAYDAEEIYSSFSKQDSLTFKPVSVDFPLFESRVTATKTILLNGDGYVSEYLLKVPRGVSSFFCCKSPKLNKKSHLPDCKQRELSTDSTVKACYLYLTGHENGSVRLWDLSTQISSICDIPFQVKGQSGGSASLPQAEAAVSCLDLCTTTGLVAVGHINGLISLFKFTSDTSRESNSPKGSNEGKKMEIPDWVLVAQLHKHKEAISCIVISSPCQCLAAGSAHGMVSIINLSTNKLIYNGRNFNVTSAIVSLNFLPFSIPASDQASKGKWFDKKSTHLLISTTKDSEMFVLDGQTGACLSPSLLKPKNGNGCLSVHVLDTSNYSILEASGSHVAFGTYIHNPAEEATNALESTSDSVKLLQSKPPSGNSGDEPNRYLLLLCTYDALRMYHVSSLFKNSFSPYNKLKLNSGLCWASVFQTPTNKIGLVLVYKSQLIELRSLPDLSILKGISLDNILNWKVDLGSSFFKTASCTTTGQLTMLGMERELIFLSTLDSKHEIGLPTLNVKTLKIASEASESLICDSPQKKKRFGKILKVANNLLKPSDKEHTSSNYKLADLEALFLGRSSVSHQSNDDGNESDSSSVSNGDNIDIDDIEIDDLDDTGGKPNKNLLKKMKQKLKSKKGPKRQQKAETGKEAVNTDDGHHGVRTVDEIKATYGHGRDEGMTGPASRLRDKLLQQRERLQDVDKKTADMKEGAENFHAMADELVKLLEEKNKRKFF